MKNIRNYLPTIEPILAEEGLHAGSWIYACKALDLFPFQADKLCQEYCELVINSIEVHHGTPHFFSILSQGLRKANPELFFHLVDILQQKGLDLTPGALCVHESHEDFQIIEKAHALKFLSEHEPLVEDTHFYFVSYKGDQYIHDILQTLILSARVGTKFAPAIFGVLQKEHQYQNWQRPQTFGKKEIQKS